MTFQTFRSSHSAASLICESDKFRKKSQKSISAKFFVKKIFNIEVEAITLSILTLNRFRRTSIAALECMRACAEKNVRLKKKVLGQTISVHADDILPRYKLAERRSFE
jgi:hypothetical protein